MKHPLFQQLLEKKITPNQYLVLWYQSQGVTPPINTRQGEIVQLQSKGLLDEQCQPTREGKRALQELDMIFSKKKKVSIEGSDEFIKQYREFWPREHRTNVATIGEKFGWFFQTFPQYRDKWDLIFRATKLYLSESSGNTWHYRADHFIVKQITPQQHRYALLDYIDKVDEGVTQYDDGLKVA